MTATTTVLDVVQEMFSRVGRDLGYFSVADAIGTTYIEHDQEFGNSRVGTDELADLNIWLYNRTGNDRVKKAGDVDASTARLAHTSNNVYTFTGNNEPYALTGLHPDIVLAAATRGHHRRSSRTHQPLITFTDADMRRPDANYWNGTSGSSANSNCTATKITTDAFEGPSALQLVFSAAGFNRGPKMRVYPGQILKTYVRFKTGANILTFNLWDSTHTQLFSGTAPTFGGLDYGVFWRQDTVPDGCYEIQVQTNCSGAATAVVDAFWGPYKFGTKRLMLPVDLDEDWRVRLVRMTSYDYNLPGVSQGYDAYNREFSGDLVPPRNGDSGDFSFEINRQDVQPYSINLYRPIEEYLNNGPIDLATEHYASASEAFAAVADTSVLGKDELTDFGMVELSKIMTRVYAKGDQGWSDRLKEYASKTAFQVMVRQPQARREIREIYRLRA